MKPQTKRYVLVTVNDGGADESEFNAPVELFDLIATEGRHRYGQPVELVEKLVAFAERSPIGAWCDWPCGWLFVVDGAARDLNKEGEYE
jgi:hypothetical protein